MPLDQAIHQQQRLPDSASHNHRSPPPPPHHHHHHKPPSSPFFPHFHHNHPHVDKIGGRLPVGIGSKCGIWIDHVDSTDFHIIIINITIDMKMPMSTMRYIGDMGDRDDALYLFSLSLSLLLSKVLSYMCAFSLIAANAHMPLSSSSPSPQLSLSSSFIILWYLSLLWPNTVWVTYYVT